MSYFFPIIIECSFKDDSLKCYSFFCQLQNKIVSIINSFNKNYLQT